MVQTSRRGQHDNQFTKRGKRTKYKLLRPEINADIQIAGKLYVLTLSKHSYTDSLDTKISKNVHNHNKMAAGTTNQLFWLYFADAMKTKSKAELGADNVFFVGSEVQKGPPGGDNMEEEWTNRGLFDMGDALLSTDNLFFIQGSSNHSYTDALSQ